MDVTRRSPVVAIVVLCTSWGWRGRLRRRGRGRGGRGGMNHHGAPML